MELLAIGEAGEVPVEIPATGFFRDVVAGTLAHYRQAGCTPPWTGYLGRHGLELVGVCGFKGAPVQGRVEIAYGTAPGCEGRGFATAMARELIRLAADHDPRLLVFAQTLPAENASTHILGKLGFQCLGVILHPEDGEVWEWERPARS